MVSQEHRALELVLIDDDIKQQLIKLPAYLQTEDDKYLKQLDPIRSNWKFVYVIQWLFSFRGIAKLAGDYFDVDAFEEELLGINYQSINQEITFLNRLKLNLISALQGSKLSNIEDFENVFRLWFGYETPLKGKAPKVETENSENEIKDAESEETDKLEETSVTEVDDEDLPTFDTLALEDKIEVLYIIMEYLTTYPQFRSQIDKFTNPSDSRITPVYIVNKNEDYLIFEDNRLYKRNLNYPSMKIPKKLKNASKNPEIDYPNIEPSLELECLTVGIYRFEKFMMSVKKNKKLYNILNGHYNSIALADVKRRKQILNRKKEIQLQNLLATRKRSSRLEQKEKKKQEDMERQREEDEIALKEASNRRASHRLKMKEDLIYGKRARDGSSEVALSREERAKLRRGENGEALPEFDSENTKDSIVSPYILSEGVVTEQFQANINGEGNAQIYEQTRTLEFPTENGISQAPSGVSLNQDKQFDTEIGTNVIQNGESNASQDIEMSEIDGPDIPNIYEADLKHGEQLSHAPTILTPDQTPGPSHSM